MPKKEAAKPQVKDERISLSAALSKNTVVQAFSVWLIGDTPLITHAWSQKAKNEMLTKQVKATKPGREARDPEEDFVNSLYDMGQDANGQKLYGFPVTGIKNSVLSCAHKDKGIPRSQVMGALYLDAEMVRVRPALSGAICDMPLVRIHGTPPEKREDMVKVGAGLNKTANLAYRGQFTVWAIKVTGTYNTTVLNDESLGFLFREAGIATGIGEWRTEKKGMFGAFHLASAEEEAAWESFAAGKGPLPIPANYQQAAE